MRINQVADTADFGARSVDIQVLPSPTGWLHVDSFRFFFISWFIKALYSINSSEMIGYLPKVLHLNSRFLKLNPPICKTGLMMEETLSC
jgi:hypothetical protein